MSKINLLIALVLIPAMALAAKKKVVQQDEDSDSSVSTQPRTIGTSVGKATLKGLSFFGSLDFTNTIISDGAQGTNTINSENAFGIGAQYQFRQFAPGFNFQGGGTYEFARSEKLGGAAANPQISTWTGYGEIAALLVPEFAVMGGLNYTFPQGTNMANVTMSGKVGYQVGASFYAAKNLAFDARYRTLNMTENVGAVTTTDKIQGLVLDGRYMF